MNVMQYRRGSGMATMVNLLLLTSMVQFRDWYEKIARIESNLYTQRACFGE